MSHNYFTPYVDKVGATPGTTFVAEKMNAPLESLDAQVKVNTDNIATNTSAIAGKAATVHNHDDRYYTAAELATPSSGVVVDWENIDNVPPMGTGDGDVVAPETNTDEYVPQWNGTDSKTLKGGFPITTVGKAVLAAADTAAQRDAMGVAEIRFTIGYDSIDKPGDAAERNCWPPACTFAINLVGWTYYSSIAPTRDVVVSIRKNGVEFATATINHTTNLCAFAGALASFNGTTDRLSFLFPALDATWKGATFGAKGVRA